MAFGRGLVLLSWMFLRVGLGAASSISSSSLVYESTIPRSLDQYGNAVQLEHAAAASHQRGRLILVLQVNTRRRILRRRGRRPLTENDDAKPVNEYNNTTTNNKDTDDFETDETSAVWVVSPVIPQPVHTRRDPARDNLLQAVTAPTTNAVDDDVEASPASLFGETPTSACKTSSRSAAAASRVYFTGSGVRADATWLLHQLRLYARLVAEQYGGSEGSPPPTSISTVAAALKRQFWGYANHGGDNEDDSNEDDTDWSAAWMPPGYALLMNAMQSGGGGGGERSTSWGRPLGIRSLLLTCCPPKNRYRQTRNNSNSNGWVRVELIEPSGIISSFQTDTGYQCCSGNQNDNKEDESMLCVPRYLAMGQSSDLVVLEMNKQESNEALSNAKSISELQDALLSIVSSALAATTSMVLNQEVPLSLQLEICSTNGMVERRVVTSARAKK